MHPRVAGVADVADCRVELLFCEGFWEEEERGPQGREEIELVCVADFRVVSEDLDGFVEPTRQVEGIPVCKIAVESGEVDDAVFD